MSLEKVEQCPVCQEKSFKPLIVCKDHSVSGELFHVEQCPHCGMALTNPRPPFDLAGTYYQSVQYISHTSKSTSFIDFIYLIIRRFTIKWKFSLIQSVLNNHNLLDIGCGTGSFAGYCKTKNVPVYGIEPSPEARTKATEQNITVYETLENLPDITFSVITMWHVLEHIYNLQDTIVRIKNHLVENGIIFIAVPNLESEDANHYKEFWAAYDVPRHVWHFSEKTINQLLNESGLKIIEKIPMKLDAYYVSLLSEKYKSNSKLSIINIFKGMLQGFRSNRKAKKSGNYSSIIYKAQKMK